MSDARIHEQGYLPYQGPRGGPERALVSLIWHSVRRLLGLKRRARAKALPIVAGLIAYVPAITFVGVAVLVPREVTDLFLPGSADYLGSVLTAVYLFAALGAPAILCPDRKHGTLAMYFASPLTRDTYLLAKAAALVGFLAIVTVGPALLLLIGLASLDAGPDGVFGFLGELLRALTSGLVVAGIVAGLSLSLSSLTDRHATASGYIVLWLLASRAIVEGLLIETLELPAGFATVDVTTVMLEATARIYGVRSDHNIATVVVIFAVIAWLAGTTAFTRWRYHRLQVTR